MSFIPVKITETRSAYYIANDAGEFWCGQQHGWLHSLLGAEEYDTFEAASKELAKLDNHNGVRIVPGIRSRSVNEIDQGFE